MQLSRFTDPGRLAWLLGDLPDRVHQLVSAAHARAAVDSARRRKAHGARKGYPMITQPGLGMDCWAWRLQPSV